MKAAELIKIFPAIKDRPVKISTRSQEHILTLATIDDQRTRSIPEAVAIKSVDGFQLWAGQIEKIEFITDGHKAETIESEPRKRGSLFQVDPEPFKIPVLSLLQPWASLVVKSYKRRETRGWATDHLGPLFIHASKEVKPADRQLFRDILDVKDNRELPAGAIIGIVVVTACMPTEKAERELAKQGCHRELVFGDYSEGRYAFTLDHAIEFDKPVPFTGSQLKIWDAVKQMKTPTDLLELQLQLGKHGWKAGEVYDKFLIRVRDAYDICRKDPTNLKA
jgi:hypothetical protein